MEEEQWGQLGVIGEIDAGTEYALRSLYRITSRRAFVQMECSRRLSKTLLWEAAGLPGAERKKMRQTPMKEIAGKDLHELLHSKTRESCG